MPVEVEENVEKEVEKEVKEEVEKVEDSAAFLPNRAMWLDSTRASE